MKTGYARYCSSLLISPDSPPCSFVDPDPSVRPSRCSARATGSTRASERFEACTTEPVVVGRRARRKISVIRTRPELVSVRNKPSNFSVRSSLRGLQFLVTSLPRRPSRFNRSFFYPSSSTLLFLSLFQFFFRRALSHGLTRCAPTLNTGPPAIVTEPESFADRSRAEETLPTFLLLLFVPPPWSPCPARLLRFPSFQPLFSCPVTSFSPLFLSLSLSHTFSPVSSSGRCRSVRYSA